MMIKKYIKYIIYLLCIDHTTFYKRILNKRKQKRYAKYQLEQRILLNKYCKEILEFINKTCIENGFHIWIEYGTLLGAVRNNHIIPHDCDMDFGIYAEEYTPQVEKLLQENGFQKLHHFILYDKTNQTKKMTEVTYTYKGLHIDIFFSFKTGIKRVSYVYHDDNLHYSYQENEKSVKRLITVAAAPFEKQILEGISCLSPANSDVYLTEVYGKNYLVPDPNWNASKVENVIEFLPEKQYIGYYIPEQE